ncbi:MAG: hypothetical protein ABI209_01740 [Edaphobacter sp.]
MHLFLSICLLGSPVLLATAQQLPNRVQGSFDQDTPLPTSGHKPLGYSDAGALAELVAYKVAIGGSGWLGMTANGNISFDGATGTLPAALHIMPGNRVKLDVTKPEGHDITVYNGVRGSATHAGSKKALLAPRGALAGFAPFDLPLKAAEAALKFSIIDHGSTVLQGNSFHRISVEVAIPKKDLFPYEKDDRLVVDMYFDPSTHLLAKTVSLIPIPGSSEPVLLKVNDYANYQQTGQFLLPMTIDETINGQSIWKLVFSSLDFTKTMSDKDFTF